MKSWRKLCALTAVSAFALLDVQFRFDGSSLLPSIDVGRPAEALVGHPLTPMSYAGVARRTVRRSEVAGAGAVIYSLPAGCVYGKYYGAYYYKCGGGGYYVRSGSGYTQVYIK